ncbi:MAG: homocysteine S-methyltransferase family protein [Pseudomonadota bacterium]
MTIYRDLFPDLNANTLLAYGGMETDLIFNKGVDLPGFASYPLLENEQGRALLRDYIQGMFVIARQTGVGVILESPTWVANRDRGAALGYTPDQLCQLNRDAIAMIAQERALAQDVVAVISANLGPRGDAYAPKTQMSAKEAEHYHSEQVRAVADTQTDILSAYTLTYVSEAIGIVRATRKSALPVVISFTVETDGHLPTGQTLKSAIEEVDAATDGYAAYYMINCAHPDHFLKILDVGAWMGRLKGIVANASRCSHAELDEATELDAGDPKELGRQIATIQTDFPHINVLGGCCGTDMRHLEEIAIRSVCRST